MSERFLRHTKMTAWGIGIVLEERGGQISVMWSDGNRRTFKAAHVAQLLVAAEPESEEQRQVLVRARASGGTRTAAVHLELEAQLEHGFDDPAPFLVYADWLLQRDDPRGALIHAQHRGIAKHEKAALKDHADVLLPPGFIRRGDFTLTWKLGFLQSVRIGTIPDLEEALATLLAHPSARLLAELILDAADYRGQPIEVIVNAGKQLRRLVLGSQISDTAWATGDIAGLFSLPRLVELEVTGERVFVGTAIAHPTMQRLSIVSRRGDPATDRAVVTIDAPALVMLSYSCLDGVETPPPGALAKLPALQALALRNTTSTRAWLERILSSPAARTLGSLDLRDGDLDDEGAAFLAASRARLPALELLDVSRNHLTSAGERALAELCESVRSTALPRDQWREGRIRTPPAITDAARAIAQANRWDALGIDVPRDRLWGRYPGTTGVYDVAAERGSSWAICSCPSNESPCKHALALHVMHQAGAMHEAQPPYDHYDRATRKRYRSGWE
jgi:uncharacterized protein (TIGR02996 family)